MNILAFLFESVFGVSLVWVPILHALIVILFGIRLISVRRPVGVAFAWFLIVIILPIIGISLYILIGERPVGRKLTRKNCAHESGIRSYYRSDASGIYGRS